MEGIKESILIGYPNEISYECTKNILQQMEKIYVKLKSEKNKELDSFVKYHFLIEIICYQFLLQIII